jgi:hypothetical protein
MIDISTLLVGTVPLITIVFGLVEFFKSLGLKGRSLTIVSLGLGLVMGFAFRLAQSGVPAAFSGWFEAIVFGLAIGLVASGFYDFANSRWPKKDGVL